MKTPLLFVFSPPHKAAIHSLFCPPFDAVFLDSKGKVVDLFEVRSTQLWIQPKLPVQYLIEAPQGFAKRLKEGQAIRVNERDAWLEFDG